MRLTTEQEIVLQKLKAFYEGALIDNNEQTEHAAGDNNRPALDRLAKEKKLWQEGLGHTDSLIKLQIKIKEMR